MLSEAAAGVTEVVMSIAIVFKQALLMPYKVLQLLCILKFDSKMVVLEITPKEAP